RTQVGIPVLCGSGRGEGRSAVRARAEPSGGVRAAAARPRVVSELEAGGVRAHRGRSVRDPGMSKGPNPLTAGPSRAPARAWLKAAGFSDGDLRKPLIGVANPWIEMGPCTLHLRTLAEYVKEGIRAAGGTPMEFNTVSISDGITMGTEGMKASLVSREVIADSIELVTRGNGFDGLVVLVGCDKTIPGGIMALARLNVP